jgi:hypothetical protein
LNSFGSGDRFDVSRYRPTVSKPNVANDVRQTLILILSTNCDLYAVSCWLG